MLAPGYLFLWITRQQLRHFTTWSDVELILATVATGVVINGLSYLLVGRRMYQYLMHDDLREHQFLVGSWLVITVVALPIALGIGAGRALRKWGDDLEWIGLDSFTRSPDGWGKAWRPDDARYLRIYLKDRDAPPILGRFGEKSLASNFYLNGDVFVEELWDADEDGDYSQMAEHTGGFWIAAETISRVEFIRPWSETESSSDTKTT